MRVSLSWDTWISGELIIPGDCLSVSTPHHSLLSRSITSFHGSGENVRAQARRITQNLPEETARVTSLKSCCTYPNQAVRFPSLNTNQLGLNLTAFSQIATLTIVPFALMTWHTIFKPSSTPTQSKTILTPSPAVISLTFFRISSVLGSRITSAPKCLAKFCRDPEGSLIIICPHPFA